MTNSDSGVTKSTIADMSLIEEYLAWLRLRRRSPRTIRCRGEVLRRMDRELPCGLEQATTEELKEWIFQPRFSRNTLATYFGTAKAFFVWACDDPHNERLDYNPMSALAREAPTAPRGIPRPATDAQLQHILGHAVEPIRTWALLAAYEGLRCIEIAGLLREHVTAETTWVMHGKGDKPGSVPTHPEVWAVVRGLPRGPIARTRAGAQASANYVSITAALHFRHQLGLPGVGMHMLRHWFGTNLMRRTNNIRVVQEMLRHASPNTTAVYTLVTSEERRAATLTLPTFTAASPNSR